MPMTTTLPLGIVALYWLRLFKPLIQADLPQTPTNRGTQGLGFTRAGFRALGSVSHLDLRVGARFTGDVAPALHQALREALQDDYQDARLLHDLSRRRADHEGAPLALGAAARSGHA
jgi:hypothetical protein